MGTQPFEDGLKRCGGESNSVAPKMGGLHEIALEEALRKEKEVYTALVRLPCERLNAGDRPFDIAKNLRCLTTPYVQHIDSIRNCVKSTFNLVPAPARACRLADLSLLTRSRCDHDGRQRSAHVFSRTTWERKTKQ